MNFEDTARVIASYLDNHTLEKLFFSGAMPSLLNLASDQYFWHARVETFSGKRFSFQNDIDWRDTYCILIRETEKRIHHFWNEKDNVLVCEILSSLGYRPDEKSLTLAAQNGCVKILQFLLQEGSIDPEETVPELYVPPLISAVREGHIEAVKLLLADPRVDPRNADAYGDADALDVACRSTREQSSNYAEIVKLLLADGRLDPGDGFYIEAACELDDNFEIVRLLLADQRVIPEDDDIVHAARLGRDGIVELLLQDGRTDPGILDDEALLRASEGGYTRTVRLLLADPRVDPSNGYALDEAIVYGYSKIIELFLQDERIPPEIREDSRRRWEER